MSVGEQVKVRELAPYYHAILFAYGASTDRKLNIPGEDLPGVYSALDFVNWYNGVPDTTLFNPKLDASDTAVVIGNGNVALDVARILLSDLDTLRKTDIAETAISTLARSKIRRVDVVGRRGLLQVCTLYEMNATFWLGLVMSMLNSPGSFHNECRS